MTRAQQERLVAAALVTRAKAGDVRAFEALVRRYRPRIFALALHLTGSAHDADDIAQEVFLSAFRSLHAFQGRSEFFTWLYRMTVNKALSAFRSRKRRHESELDEDPRVELAVGVDAPGNPARAAELRQTYARLVAALDALPSQMRATVVLVALQGLSYGEAAVVQGVPEGTIAWRIHEARRRLASALAPEGPDDLPTPEESADLARMLDGYELKLH